MRLTSACLALVLMGAPSAAFAQAAAASGPEAEKVALATKILEETHTQDNMALLLDETVPQMVAVVKQQSPGITDETVKLLTDLLLQAMKDKLPKLVEMNASVYAHHFTLDELKAMDAFHASPTGQKVIAEMPDILRETAPIGAAWGRAAAQDALAEIVAKLRAQGVRI